MENNTTNLIDFSLRGRVSQAMDQFIDIEAQKGKDKFSKNGGDLNYAEDLIRQRMSELSIQPRKIRSVNLTRTISMAASVAILAVIFLGSYMVQDNLDIETGSRTNSIESFEPEMNNDFRLRILNP